MAVPLTLIPDRPTNMITTQIGTSPLIGSRLAYGCWRIAGDNPAELTPAKGTAGRRAVIAAYEAGYTLFNHADIYGRGAAERLFGQVLKEVTGMRPDRRRDQVRYLPQGYPRAELARTLGLLGSTYRSRLRGIAEANGDRDH